MQCRDCGLSYPDDVRLCPSCGSANSFIVTSRSKSTSAASQAGRRSGSATAVATKPRGFDVYTECPWQRPDGRWLNSKEIAEMENLAQQYASIRNVSWLGNLLGNKNGSPKQRQEAIRKRVESLGIPFGIFQAYSNSLDR